ncbi:hypothetical protein VTL71DRAFT_7838 [Oculimacula yallundae]|uniref:Uncharacterized protein n=1 Tax=Oculimacula yallundae TaxID=86028 RepID=A0ABR4CVU0_9HELO
MNPVAASDHRSPYSETISFKRTYHPQANHPNTTTSHPSKPDSVYSYIPRNSRHAAPSHHNENSLNTIPYSTFHPTHKVNRGCRHRKVVCSMVDYSVKGDLVL